MRNHFLRQFIFFTFYSIRGRGQKFFQRINKIPIKYLTALCLMTLILHTLSEQALAQCAMCKAAAESDLQNNPNSLAKGLNQGIIYLMLIPYLLIAFFFRKEIIRFIKGKKESPTHN